MFGVFAVYILCLAPALCVTIMGGLTTEEWWGAVEISIAFSALFSIGRIEDLVRELCDKKKVEVEKAKAPRSVREEQEEALLFKELLGDNKAEENGDSA